MPVRLPYRGLRIAHRGFAPNGPKLIGIEPLQDHEAMLCEYPSSPWRFPLLSDDDDDDDTAKGDMEEAGKVHFRLQSDDDDDDTAKGDMEEAGKVRFRLRSDGDDTAKGDMEEAGKVRFRLQSDDDDDTAKGDMEEAGKVRFRLQSDDDDTAEGDMEVAGTRKVRSGAIVGTQILTCQKKSGHVSRRGRLRTGPPLTTRIIYNLAGPSFLARYLDAHPESDFPDWEDYDLWDAAEDKGTIEEEEKTVKFDMVEDVVEGSFLLVLPTATVEEEEKSVKSDMGEDIGDEEYIGFLNVLPMATPVVDDYRQLAMSKRLRVYRRHALYRIKACKLLQGKPIADLDVAKLKSKYTRKRLREKGYFQRYEQDGTFGWFFHPDHCRLAGLDDYQRLVPINDGGYEYIDWESYRLSYYTHEIDREYVEYCNTISKELKWIEAHLALELTRCDDWFKLRNRAAFQAMKIATRFTKISVGLAHLAFTEYISFLCRSFRHLKDMDGIYFEIWKRVVNQKKGFRDALEEVYEQNKFPMRQNLMHYALHHDWPQWETTFCSCTADIDKDFEEVEARWWIRKRLKIMFKMSKGYQDYAWKKLKIAEILGLIPRA